MKLIIGDTAPNIILPSIEGIMIDTGEIKTAYLLSFYRFASCPFCNIRLHQLIKRYKELDPNFIMIAVFDSPLENLTKHASGHKAPFPILADNSRKYYDRYGLTKSVTGMIKGMIFRFPTLVKAMLKGYFPFPIKGSLIGMPADFLIDENGTIQLAYYGKDEGDHVLFEKVLTFSKRN